MARPNLVPAATKPGYVVVEAVSASDGNLCLVVNGLRVAGAEPSLRANNIQYRWNVREEYLQRASQLTVDRHKDYCMCEDCKLSSLEAYSDAQRAADERKTVPVLVTIPEDLSHTGKERQATKPIDACVADLVMALNAVGVLTRVSCCGHGKEGQIDLADGTVIKIPAHTCVAP